MTELRPELHHKPVLLQESVQGLNISPGDTVIDCTLGAGGHAKAILETLGESGKLLGIERDPEMLAIARKNLKSFAAQCTLIHGNFADIADIARANNFTAVHGVIADLGLSSVHIDSPERGFSFRHDAPLDMRFDPTGGRTSAQELVNTLSVQELTDIFREFGEERYAYTIAKNIHLKRKQKEIQTTRELAVIIESCIPPKKQKLHPATKVFQALRIFINDELGALTGMLGSLPHILVPGGRAAIIAYHSLEDRIVKNYFKIQSKKCTCPPEFPRCICEGPIFTLITRRPTSPSESEIRRNPRARSAKLRIAERTTNT